MSSALSPSPAPTPAAVLDALRRLDPSVESVDAVTALSGGMSREIWAVDLRRNPSGDSGAAVLRRDPVEVDQGASWERLQATKTGELEAMRAAHAAGVPVPRPWGLLEDVDALGSGLVMDRVSGETLAGRILRDETLASTRGRLARECGGALARLHGVDVAPLCPHLQGHDPVTLWRELLDDLGLVSPALELGLRHLVDRAPAPRGPALVHGDFRLGNLVVDAGGLVAVLDWEAAHLGEPGEDLGWLCAPQWRSGRPGEVSGFGPAEELMAGYADAGGAPFGLDELRYWELFATVRWAVLAQMLAELHLSGIRPSLELALTGRERAAAEAVVVELVASWPGRETHDGR